MFKFSEANSKYPAQHKYLKSRFLNLNFPVVLFWFFKSVLVSFFRFLLCVILCWVPIFLFVCPILFWTLSSCVISLNPIVVVLFLKFNWFLAFFPWPLNCWWINFNWCLLSGNWLEESLALLSRYCFGEFDCLNHKRFKARSSSKYKYKKQTIHFEGHNKEEQKQAKGVHRLASWN